MDRHAAKREKVDPAVEKEDRGAARERKIKIRAVKTEALPEDHKSFSAEHS